jgi:S1-C subfamily serine protease
MNKSVLLLILFFQLSSAAYPQDDLPRQGMLGFTMREPSPGKAGAIIRSVDAGSNAEKAGIKENDLVLRINEIFLSDLTSFNQALLTVDGNTKAKLQVVRNNRLQEMILDVPPLKKESLAGVITEYSSVVTSYGYRVRTIVTTPKNATGKAFLF